MVEAHPAEQQQEQQQTQEQEREKTAASFLLEDIRRRACLPPNVTPEDAIRAVMCTFSQHVSGGEAHHVWSALPGPVKPLLERCMIHRKEQASRFSRDDLLLRISPHLGVPIEQAEEITSAVLTAISSRLPAKEVADVAAQLPRDLRDLWVVRKVPLAAPVEPHPILSRIEQAVRLPSGVTGMGAFTAVTCHLSKRLTLGEARHFFKTLPSDLRQLVEPCLEGRGEQPEHFNKAAYLERLTKDLKITDKVEAEKVARTVFRCIEEYVPATVFKHVAAQLPRELSDLWALP